MFSVYQLKQEHTRGEGESERQRKMAELAPRKFEVGIGPATRDGMPLVLRSVSTQVLTYLDITWIKLAIIAFKQPSLIFLRKKCSLCCLDKLEFCLKNNKNCNRSLLKQMSYICCIFVKWQNFVFLGIISSFLVIVDSRLYGTQS